MNQELKQVFSTIQQVKLRQLQLEVEALQKQIENNLQINEEYVEEVIQSSVSHVRIEDLKEKTVIKLT